MCLAGSELWSCLLIAFWCSVSLVCIFLDVCPIYFSDFVVSVLSLCLVKLDLSLFVGLIATSILKRQSSLHAISDAVVILVFSCMDCSMFVFLHDSTLLIKCWE